MLDRRDGAAPRRAVDTDLDEIDGVTAEVTGMPALPAGPFAPMLAFLPSPRGWTDPFTALDGPVYWARLVSSEGARIRRWPRPATVVLFEVVGLDRLARSTGDDVAVACTIQVARTLAHHLRSSDHAARIGRARFAAFLPETNEVDAINFVERCRAAIDAELCSTDDAVTLAIGWAGPVKGDLDAAIGLAETRLEREIAAS